MRQQFAYDSMGRPTTTTYPENAVGESFEIVNNYTSLSYLESIQDNSSYSGEEYVRAVEYDANGRNIETFIADRSQRIQTEFDIDTGRMTNLMGEVVGGDTLYDFNYVRDLNGNIEEIYGGDPTIAENLMKSYEYDDLNRMTEFGNYEEGSLVDTYEYQYNSIGNMTMKEGETIDYDNPQKPHQVTGRGEETFTYDYLGRRNEVHGKTINYNGFNLPESMEGLGGNSYYTYDANGVRVRVIDEETGVTSTYIMGGSYEVHTDEIDGGNRRDVYNLGPAQITDIEGIKTVQYMHKNHLGSPTMITNQTGEILKEMEHMPYGESVDTGVEDTSDETNKSFTGYRQDTDLLNILL